MKRFVYIFLLLVIPLSLNAYSFSRTLQVGSEGQDVMELQKYLNANPATQVSSNGVGSPGQETSYFGEKTKQGVIKLQNLFASAILYPVGLSFGTGFVGNSTINFLNSNQSASTATTQTPSQGAVNITSVSPEKFYSGDTITITGSNFSPTNNTIILTFESRTAYANIPSTDNGTKIEFEFESSIQNKYDEEYSDMPAKSQKIVKEQFPEIPIAVSVVSENNKQSNFKIINFILK